jgi:hypothetical protein
MMQWSDLQRSILLEGLRDYQSTRELVADVRYRLGPGADHSLVRRTVLQALRPLVEAGYVELGDLELVGEFSELAPWVLQGKAAVDELERRWIQLGRDPDVGELAWMQLTALGEKIAQGLESGT